MVPGGDFRTTKAIDSVSVLSHAESRASHRLHHPSCPLAATELDGSHSLPSLLTPLIGREREVAAICELLLRPTVRLVTLTGPGGVDKTRLGLQVASQVTGDFRHVHFVALASESNHEMVASTIAHALRIREPGDESVVDQVTSFLRGSDVLLVLDNFEHLVTAAPTVVGLLAACPRLTALVTCRAVLQVSSSDRTIGGPVTSGPILIAADRRSRMTMTVTLWFDAPRRLAAGAGPATSRRDPWQFMLLGLLFGLHKSAAQKQSGKGGTARRYPPFLHRRHVSVPARTTVECSSGIVARCSSEGPIAALSQERYAARPREAVSGSAVAQCASREITRAGGSADRSGMAVATAQPVDGEWSDRVPMFGQLRP